MVFTVIRIDRSRYTGHNDKQYDSEEELRQAILGYFRVMMKVEDVGIWDFITPIALYIKYPLPDSDAGIISCVEHVIVDPTIPLRPIVESILDVSTNFVGGDGIEEPWVYILEGKPV